jgi:hypothetical protein
VPQTTVKSKYKFPFKTLFNSVGANATSFENAGQMLAVLFGGLNLNFLLQVYLKTFIAIPALEVLFIGKMIIIQRHMYLLKQLLSVHRL